MRIFVFEYISGGGLAGQPMLADLAREGDMMLAFLIRDLLGIPGTEIHTTRDSRLQNLDLEAVRVRPVSSRKELAAAWSAEVAKADAVWPIAPETDGILDLLCGWVELAGRPLLNSRANAVRVAGSKIATAHRLEEFQVPVVATRHPTQAPPAPEACWVLKPDRGVGCIGARLVRGERRLVEAVGELPRCEDWVVQPYLCGQAASLSLLVRDWGVELLGCNVQRVALNDDRFVLLGCEVNGLECDRAAYERLAEEIVRSLPGLWGYVGVDLVVTADGPVVLEVNPRLTTSYIGLSQSLGMNVAEMVVDMIRDGGPSRGPRWRPRRVDVDLEQCHVA